ncbi:signal peptidase I [Clostridium argentinense CDC 2741]|uniref:Signal peptidase I n=1 Tax=Clostridium argentinense CDC 2741 TaxID=1418104 RepID=A0A0C1R090_9CLOT|nr:signal peptidase I [Clostridium argentinense]ARC85369.1 signal peptidase I [Clostridium argentinense]KIE46822.1 signal peptidase I [Clostridium argentinense CDC 2741]NFF41728.1 signal peptidase I [Clostridium argentinense]NFP52024.1 signal peptidase I [Clostridium argentinense]NFP73491.1 signal peptidase I [Clostridium argentinense]
MIKDELRQWSLAAIIGIILALGINYFLFFICKIPSASMEPTIMTGNRLIATRVYNKDKIKNGEIVVFYSEEESELLIKRVIGISGDKIKIQDNGEVFVNDKKLEENYVLNNEEVGGEYTVPKDHFFFLGDNRARSFDSRKWNNPYIHKKDIKGKARIIIYPFSRIKIM